MCVAECMYGLNILIDEVIKKEIKAEIYQKFMKIAKNTPTSKRSESGR